MISDRTQYCLISVLGVGCIIFAYIAGFLGGQFMTAIVYILLAIICITIGVTGLKKGKRKKKEVQEKREETVKFLRAYMLDEERKKTKKKKI